MTPGENHAGVGYAVDLAKVTLSQIAPEVDFHNPGYSFGFGIFDHDNKLVSFMPNPDMASQAITELGAATSKYISFNPQTGKIIEAKYPSS